MMLFQLKKGDYFMLKKAPSKKDKDWLKRKFRLEMNLEPNQLALIGDWGTGLQEVSTNIEVVKIDPC